MRGRDEFLASEASAPSRRTLGWRLLTTSSVRSLGLGLTLLFFPSLATGILIGGNSDDVLPALTAFLLGLLFVRIFVGVHGFSDPEERRWLVSLTHAAFALRTLVAVVVFHGPWNRYALGEDQYGYDFYPQMIAAYWAGDTFQPALLSTPVVQSRIGYFNFVSLQYYLLGPSLLLPRLINCVAGALLVFYGYRLATHVFGVTEGRVVAVWTALFPSLVLWSAVNLRDIWMALSVLVIVTHSVTLRDRFRWASVAIIAAHLIWIQYSRPYLVVIMGMGILSVFALARTRSLGRDLVLVGMMASVLFVLHISTGLGEEGLGWLDLERISTQRDVLARSDVGQSGYLPGLNLNSPEVLAAFFPVLVAYFLLSPFPWQMTAPRRLITLPEMVFWYWLIPFVIFEVRRVLRERDARHMALLLSVSVITIACALPSANVGLAYRHRAQVISLLLPFAAAGYVARRAPALSGHAALAPG